MKRTFPLIITALSGFILLTAFFIPVAQPSGEAAAIWFDLLAAIAFLLGGGNLLKQHLKKVSDQRKGWGYSGIIIVSFLLTLFFGLTKWGSQPLGKTEFVGESFVEYPIEWLPEVAIPGTIPQRADGELLPVSVRRQITQQDDKILFRGWMTDSQQEDLLKYQDNLKWRATVEELYIATQPNKALHDKLSYLADQGAVSFKGMLTPEEEQILHGIFEPLPNGPEVVQQLTLAARTQYRIEVPLVPAGFQIPQEAQNYVQLAAETLTVTGPITNELRDQLAFKWTHIPRMRSLNETERGELRQQIEAAGIPLNQAQLAAFDTALNTRMTAPAVLILLLNAAGVAPAGEKTYRQLLAEYEQGSRFLDRTIPPTDPDIVLNAAQEAVVAQFLQDSKLSLEEFKTQLSAAGPTNDAVLAAADKFYTSQPSVPEFHRELCLALLEAGDLTTAQRELLVKPYREDYQWRRAIGRLAVQSHQTKYPWSGDYDQSGSPFWWLYQYIFQPLLTTTFAVLAFYVASAAFRAFRAKNIEATLLLGTAFLILLRPTVLGTLYSTLVPEALSMDNLTSFIMGTMNTAGNRAIMIGIALGIASTSLKVLLGIDRSYLGSSDE